MLLVMRLDDMLRVHPDQIESICSQCSQPVGIYPSGQTVLKKYGTEMVDIVCSHCYVLTKDAVLAPGAREESTQSVWNTSPYVHRDPCHGAN